MKWLRITALVIALPTVATAGWLWHVNFNDGINVNTPEATASTDPAHIQHGQYLAKIANCMACHTARGGQPGAGGLAIQTGFGTVYTSNLTPDEPTGIGHWNANTFWRALHHGRDAHGRLLAPVFPYTHTTLLRRADSDALFAYFTSLPAVNAVTPPHELRWPYGTQAALAIWRARYFKPGALADNPQHNADWNRGSYLTRAVAHCSVCHAPRDALGGANWQDLRGGPMAGLGWYAPSLQHASEASLRDWPTDEIVQLLQSGVAPQGRVNGPMAEAVRDGLQHLTNQDATAIAHYLQSLPSAPARPAPTHTPSTPEHQVVGAQLYEQHCADCHGANGQGHGQAYPPLAGNRAVTMPRTDNLLQVVLYGGFNPATAGNPQPFGMPPFLLALSDGEIAAILSHIRTSWGNQASTVSATQVHTQRARTAATGDS